MHKRLKIIISILLIAMSLSACKSITVNNLDTGEIEYQKTNEYIDGEYSAVFTYPNNDGWIGYMDITLADSMITKINFDYINKDGEKRSVLPESPLAFEAIIIEQYNSFLYQLTNKIIATQIIQSDIENQLSDVKNDYLTLLNNLLKNAQTGNNKKILIPTSYVYEAKSTLPDQDGYIAVLNVTFEDDTIYKVVFYETDYTGKYRIDDPKTIPYYFTSYGVTYNQKILDIETLQIGKEALELIPNDSRNIPFIEKFNTLAMEINTKRDYTYDTTILNNITRN